MRIRLRYLLLLVGLALTLYVLLILSRRSAEDEDVVDTFRHRKTIKKGQVDPILAINYGGDGVTSRLWEQISNLSAEWQDIDAAGSPPKKEGHKEGRRSFILPRGKLSQLGPHQQQISGVTCSPRENITFLKVHKTGSSTVQNIFLRFGDKHNLRFVLPPYGHHLGYPNYFEKKHMLHNKSDTFNIFCHHTRFSEVIPRIMPPSTYYITIVRDPVKVFESAFTYFKMDYRLGMTNDPEALQKFLDDADTFYKNQVNKVHMKNTMLYDLGVPLAVFDSEPAIKKTIKTFHKRFRLVIVAEYFEESLILLRDLLCWKTEDVVVFKMNTRKDDSILPLSVETKAKIREWNKGDVLLYEHFNRTLQQKIGEYGRERMAQEVADLKEKTDKLYDRCIESDSADKEQGDFKVWQPFGVHINAFVLKADRKEDKECERMILPEIQYTKNLRKKQFPDLKEPDMRARPQKRSKRKLPPTKV